MAATSEHVPARAHGNVARHVRLAAGVTALGGLLFGYDTGVISGALLFIGKTFPLTSFEKELLTSLLLIGAVGGALVSGRVADLIGRRPTILITAVTFILGVLGAAFSPSYGFLLAMRIVIGLAVGSASMTVPMYIAEIAPSRVRGGLVSLNQLMITVGILVSYLVDYWLATTGNWRLMFGLAAIPAGVLFLGVLFQQESPHFLVRTGRTERAREVLATVREDSDIDAEIRDIESVSRKQEQTRTKDLLDPRVRPVVWIGVTLAVLQQVTGINTVIYYAPTLLKSAGMGSSASLLANVAVGAINVAMTVVAIKLLDRTGRRPLLIAGTAGMAAAMILVAVSFSFGSGTSLAGSAAITAVVGLMLYTGSFAVGLGPVFWLLISEIYPLRIRGRAMSVATMANWGANFIVTISFLTLLNAIEGLGTFLLFGFLSLVAVAYFLRFVPETKQRTLEQIEADVDERRLGTAAA